MPSTAEAPPGIVPWCGPARSPASIVHAGHQQVGEPGEGGAGIAGRDRARQHPHADQEALLLAEDPRRSSASS
jgi:hypothetical protein